MTPDKIYLPKTEVEERAEWLIQPYENDTDFDECYLKKDALLEWLKEKHRELTINLESQDDAVLWGQRNAFQQVIDKINTL